jgi:hypothetical protein
MLNPNLPRYKLVTISLRTRGVLWQQGDSGADFSPLALQSPARRNVFLLECGAAEPAIVRVSKSSSRVSA